MFSTNRCLFPGSSLEMCTSGSYLLSVGPYRLEKILGKGQTGLVKLGLHKTTGDQVAVKIVNKEKLSESVLLKVEREIAIMKLMDHPNVLALYEVYESKKHLYLTLEHVSGGELFDYLVRKGRLIPKEARTFFRQIVSAIDFCHCHGICHRDLKPENLLLDGSNNVRVADFGMASLQVEGSMLETSCGSPHYACPEVIRGEKYDGRKADVWSCGIILYALLVGALPFDDDNLRQLLEKVKRGIFHIPHFVPPECQDLLRKMITVDPQKRLGLKDVMLHPWVVGRAKDDQGPTPYIKPSLTPPEIKSVDDLDPDVLSNMNSLGCFKDKEKLVTQLVKPSDYTQEKIIYSLLLDRKLKKPCQEDAPDILRERLNLQDPPRKRVDSPARMKPLIAALKPQLAAVDIPISYGVTPMTCRKAATISRSLNLSPLTSPRGLMPDRPITCNVCTQTPPPTPQRRRPTTNTAATTSPSSVQPEQKPFAALSGYLLPWKTKISSLKNSFLGSPRFHRRKIPTDDIAMADTMESPEMQKRPWFTNWFLPEKEEQILVIVHEKSLPSIKADIVHAFLAAQELSHTVISQTCFKAELKQSGQATGVFQRNLRFQVDIQPCPGAKETVGKETHYVFFTLHSGQYRKFKKIVEIIHGQLTTSSRTKSCPPEPQELHKID